VVQGLKLVVDSYQLIVAAFLKPETKQKIPTALLTVEIRSRELLVVWIAACIARFVTAK
jgi:hypothetical protein